ncbi:MAG: hypothetical protein ACE3JR_13675 [Ectobacillus sp.]
MEQTTNVYVAYTEKFRWMYQHTEGVIIPKADKSKGIIVFSYINKEGKWIAVLYALELNPTRNVYHILGEIDAFQFESREQLQQFVDGPKDQARIEWLWKRGKLAKH